MDDVSLAPIFKVLLRSPLSSRRRINELPLFAERPSRAVSLSANNSIPMAIFQQAVESQLLEISAPSIPLSSWNSENKDTKGYGQK
jgi:hypothetical protein